MPLLSCWAESQSGHPEIHEESKGPSSAPPVGETAEGADGGLQVGAVGTSPGAGAEPDQAHTGSGVQTGPYRTALTTTLPHPCLRRKYELCTDLSPNHRAASLPFRDPQNGPDLPTHHCSPHTHAWCSHQTSLPVVQTSPARSRPVPFPLPLLLSTRPSSGFCLFWKSHWKAPPGPAAHLDPPPSRLGLVGPCLTAHTSVHEEVLSTGLAHCRGWEDAKGKDEDPGARTAVSGLPMEGGQGSPGQASRRGAGSWVWEGP